MAKKILAIILAAMLLACLIGCDDEKKANNGNEIDVSTGGFFDDGTDTTSDAGTDAADTTDADSTAADTDETKA